MPTKNIENFLHYVEERFGIYLNTIHGYHLLYNKILEWQQVGCQRTGLTIEQLDIASVIRGDNPPSQDLAEWERSIKHRMTQGEWKKSNLKGGLNHRVALEDCLCTIFNRWREFKEHVLKKKGAADKSLMPVMDYLKNIRDRLTHDKNSMEGMPVNAYQLA